MAVNIYEPMLTTNEVSRWLGIAPRTVCTWAECSELPGIKIGRQWRFRRAEITRWLQRSRADEDEEGHKTSMKVPAAPTMPKLGFRNAIRTSE